MFDTIPRSICKIHLQMPKTIISDRSNRPGRKCPDIHHKLSRISSIHSFTFSATCSLCSVEKISNLF